MYIFSQNIKRMVSSQSLYWFSMIHLYMNLYLLLMIFSGEKKKFNMLTCNGWELHEQQLKPITMFGMLLLLYAYIRERFKYSEDNCNNPFTPQSCTVLEFILLVK